MFSDKVVKIEATSLDHIFDSDEEDEEPEVSYIGLNYFHKCLSVLIAIIMKNTCPYSPWSPPIFPLWIQESPWKIKLTALS